MAVHRFLGSFFLQLRVALRNLCSDSDWAGGGLAQPFVLPINFITTTVVLIAISICLHMSVGAIRRERRIDVWRYIIIASLLNVVFFGLQSTGMLTMIERLQDSVQQDRSLYGFTFLMVLIHALHVVGGSAGLVFIMFGLTREAYDHERYWPIKFCALYWHFLDVVWVLMLAASHSPLTLPNRVQQEA